MCSKSVGVMIRCRGNAPARRIVLTSYSELAREKMWARIHLIPALQAEEDRDQVRRYLADRAREKELLGSETRVYNSDRCVSSVLVSDAANKFAGSSDQPSRSHQRTRRNRSQTTITSTIRRWECTYTRAKWTLWVPPTVAGRKQLEYQEINFIHDPSSFTRDLISNPAGPREHQMNSRSCDCTMNQA
jgi:hypothetical protein